MSTGTSIFPHTVIVRGVATPTTAGGHAPAENVCQHRDGSWVHTDGACPGDACPFKHSEPS
jgi:hypothetical protein